MIIRIELTDSGEDEIVIKCRQINDGIRRIEQFIREQGAPARLVFYKGGQEYYFPLEDVLFFETGGDSVYAHTREDSFSVRPRLYALEQTLPRHFVRAAKSALVNARHVYSLERNLTGASLIRFRSTHKTLYASRMYLGELRRRLNEERTT